MSFRRVLQSTVVACLSVSAPSLLAQAPPAPRPVLLALDLNHDGTLTTAELDLASKSLLRLDKNRDGQLSMDECLPPTDNAGASPGEMVKRLMAFDRNGDGFLSTDELPTRMQGMFRRGDANHDGKLTTDEIQAMAATQGSPAGPVTRPGQAGGAMRTDPVLNALDADHDGTLSESEIRNAASSLKALDGNGDGLLRADELRPRQPSPKDRADHLLEEWDTNKDGKIAKAEAPDRLQQQFEHLDTNADGFLTQEELIAFFAQATRPPQVPAPGVQPTTKEQKQ